LHLIEYVVSDYPTQVNEYFLGWFENLGQGNFSDKKMIESIYSSYTLIDINNDGVKDMIVNGASFKKLINDGDGNFTYGGLLNIPGLSGSQILSVGDVDADGVEDLIVYANSVLAWYKNAWYQEIMLYLTILIMWLTVVEWLSQMLIAMEMLIWFAFQVIMNWFFMKMMALKLY
jgi:hypothetical protein